MVEEQTIPSNLRLITIMEMLAQAGIPMTPTDVNKKLGLPKPTIHRLFSTLEQEGFIERDLDGRHYSPARRSRTMAASILSTTRLRTARAAILTELADKLGETCNISLPERDGMVYLERVETKWPLRFQLSIGSKVPLYCTASGKLYLSTLSKRSLMAYLEAMVLKPHAKNTITDIGSLIEELDMIAQRGYSIDNEEFIDDMVAVSVPIKSEQGLMMAALATHGPKSRIDLTAAESIANVLRQSADTLTRSMID